MVWIIENGHGCNHPWRLTNFHTDFSKNKSFICPNISRAISTSDELRSDLKVLMENLNKKVEYLLMQNSMASNILAWLLNTVKAKTEWILTEKTLIKQVRANINLS